MLKRFKRGSFAWDTIATYLVALVLLIILIVLISLFREKLFNLFEGAKRFFG